MRSLVAVLLATLLGPAVASADWGAPVALSPAGGDAYAAGVAAAGDRPAALIATRRGGARGWSLDLRTSEARGRFRAPAAVAASRNAFESAGLFAGPDGDLVAGWLEIVNGSRRPVVATGPRLADRQVLAPGPRSTQVLRLAADRRGDAIAAFWRYDGQGYAIFAAYRPAGGGFGAPQLLATGFPGDPAVAIDEGGVAVVAWTDRDGAHVAERAAGADAFAPPVSIKSPSRPTSDAGVGVDGRVVVSWVVGAISDPRTVLVAERPSAGEGFGAPVALSAPGVRVPHWITPVVSLGDARALVAWVEGVLHTTTHDRAALAVSRAGGPWAAPVVRGVRAPAHVYVVDLLASDPTRPPILAMTTSQRFRLAALTATVRPDGTLAPSRPVPAGGPVGFRPWLAQGAGQAWLATERTSGPASRPRHQVLLFRSR
ncbi:MAG: hypothetical protein E6G10_25575 [Actinobacteria bacterium]|nr:MAG: hypothetical protein E6G10_25575 [Actinomycetota bacterium]